MIDRIIGDKKDLALLILRVVIGVIMVAHGLQKFQQGISAVTTFLDQQAGIPLPGLFAWALAVTETVVGAALILGFASRVAALLLSLILIAAIMTVKSKVGLIAPQGMGSGMELDLALLAGLLAILLQGGGAFALERRIRRRA
jgi:putative oxidoreductase